MEKRGFDFGEEEKRRNKRGSEVEEGKKAKSRGDHASISINNQEFMSSDRRPNEQEIEMMQISTMRSCSIRGVMAQGDGVLHIAAGFGHVELANAILERQDAVSLLLLLQGNNRGDRPLNCAVRSGRRCKEMAQLIVDKAKQIGIGEHQYSIVANLLRAKNLDGRTCLHEAVLLGDAQVVEYLVSQDVGLDDLSCQSLVQIVDNEGVSPLYLATTLRRHDIVHELITRIPSCDPGAASHSGPNGKTALHAAVRLSKELSETLVNWNPHLIRIPDQYGSTPLHYLAVGCSGWLSHPFLGYSLICRFITSCCITCPHFTVVSELLLEMDPSSGYCEDSEGSLPIHIAAANGMLGVIGQFIKMSPGCELSSNASGQTILHVSAQRGRYDVVQYIFKTSWSNMILNTRDKDGNTALHLALQKGCSRTFFLLMSRSGVNLSFRNKNGHTPLDLAVLSCKSRLIILPARHEWIRNHLLAAGADFGTYRGDHFYNIPQSGRADSEALSEKVTKSAIVMATCAVLIFNAALGILLNVERSGAESKSIQWRDIGSSAFAISIFAVAGFPIVGVTARIFALIWGLWMLIISSLFILEALSARLALTDSTPGTEVDSIIITNLSFAILVLCYFSYSILASILLYRIGKSTQFYGCVGLVPSHSAGACSSMALKTLSFQPCRFSPSCQSYLFIF
uniref:Uncharacterized protein n=1 Tax=Leersia perrieri TaxID=77586 RepID=A0A0D9XC61_9ORYZ